MQCNVQLAILELVLKLRTLLINAFTSCRRQKLHCTPHSSKAAVVVVQQDFFYLTPGLQGFLLNSCFLSTHHHHSGKEKNCNECDLGLAIPAFKQT